MSMGFQECINLHESVASAAASSEVGRRRNRMAHPQLVWAVCLRSVIFAYALAVPLLLVVGFPGHYGVAFKDASYHQYVPELIGAAVASLIAGMEGLLLADGVVRLVEMRRDRRYREKEGLPCMQRGISLGGAGAGAC